MARGATGSVEGRPQPLLGGLDLEEVIEPEPELFELCRCETRQWLAWSRAAETVLSEDLGRPVVAELEDGRVMLKRLASGSRHGVWSLLSVNPTHQSLIDVPLKWAARAFSPLPRDKIRRFDP